MRGFRVFLGCLVLGVAITAAVGSLGEALKAGLARDARMILGGDLELVQFSQPLADDVTRYLEANGTALSHVVTMRGMAHTQDRARRSLVEIKAVDGAYPLVASVLLEGGLTLEAALRDGGAVADGACSTGSGSRSARASGSARQPSPCVPCSRASPTGSPPASPWAPG